MLDRGDPSFGSASDFVCPDLATTNAEVGSSHQPPSRDIFPGTTDMGTSLPTVEALARDFKTKLELLVGPSPSKFLLEAGRRYIAETVQLKLGEATDGISHAAGESSISDSAGAKVRHSEVLVLTDDVVYIDVGLRKQCTWTDVSSEDEVSDDECVGLRRVASLPLLMGNSFVENFKDEGDDIAPFYVARKLIQFTPRKVVDSLDFDGVVVANSIEEAIAKSEL